MGQPCRTISCLNRRSWWCHITTLYRVACDVVRSPRRTRGRELLSNSASSKLCVAVWVACDVARSPRRTRWRELLLHPAWSNALRRRQGGGQPLPDELAGRWGGHFGQDLAALRVHTDPEAGGIAKSLQATAFTHGNDIYFAPGRLFARYPTAGGGLSPTR